jgi:hypothetical protein
MDGANAEARSVLRGGTTMGRASRRKQGR